MASNRLPANLEELITLAEDAADGAQQLEAAIGLQQNKEAGLRADLADLVAQKNAYDTAVSARALALHTALSDARSNARGFLTLARDVFKTFLGPKPSAAWEAPGWDRDSIAVPSTSDRLLPLLQSVELYLTANPARQNAALNLTPARAAALHTALSDARSAANAQDDTIAARKRERDVSEEKLRRRLRGLIDELTQLLEPLDSRWLSFGLKRPGAPESPDAVQNTRATALGGGQVRVQCDPAPRADYYQVWIQVVGVDADFRLADSLAEPDKVLARRFPNKREGPTDWNDSPHPARGHPLPSSDEGRGQGEGCDGRPQKVCEICGLEGLPVSATVNVKMRAVNETGVGPFGKPAQVSVT